MAEALGLYEADFATTEYSDWTPVVREEVRMQALDIVGKLAQLQVQAGDTSAAQATLERGIKIDTYNEELYRRLMSLHNAAGRGDLVKATYRLLERRLEEIGLLPSPETEELVS